MELEWRVAAQGVTVSGLVDRFLDGLKNEAQKRGARLDIRRPFEMPGAGDLVAGEDQETLFWQSDCRVFGLARRLETTNRIAFLRVIGRLNEEIAGVARDIMGSMVDQDPQRPTRWALYDLLYDAPPGFELESSSLRSGHIQLRLVRGQITLRVDRLSMAGLLLKDRSLSEWLEDFLRKDLRDLDYDIEGFRGRDHQGIKVLGRAKSRWRMLLSPLPIVNARKRVSIDGCAWHCPDSNKLYAVLTYFKKQDGVIPVEEACGGMVCH